MFLLDILQFFHLIARIQSFLLIAMYWGEETLTVLRILILDQLYMARVVLEGLTLALQLRSLEFTIDVIPRCGRWGLITTIVLKLLVRVTV